MKAYRDDVRARMKEFGRDPDTCKIFFLVSPLIAETKVEAEALRKQREVDAANNIDMRLARLGWSTNIDFSGFDLDAPVGELSTNGHQFSLAQFLKTAGKKTLREAIVHHSSSGYGLDLVGTPDSIAGEMAEAMEEIGGDGFLFELPNTSRRSIAGITDGLVPQLQQRNLVRRAYAHEQFRDNLLEF
jgi:alkanesulfonate monooxygenase SsuD/methylene tetrahydromethanopterin reductase-like flavin-dependent oxidoreductase (luciferase family)